ncbi:MAG: hypothetical protein ABS79_05080 [Planctomycetes bacterium SCN 63-9]|nr:MAG: hypothetical protein ABS79_05080 [Planctomycetes bacterium SCN 63-9]
MVDSIENSSNQNPGTGTITMNTLHSNAPTRVFWGRRLALSAFVGLILVPVAFIQAQQGPSQSAVEREAVHALARLEPRTGIVQVGARPGARILKIAVQEGEVVKANTLLATLEGYEQAQQQLALATAQKKNALEQRARAREKVKLERAQMDATLDLQKSALNSQNEMTKKKKVTAQGLYTGLSAVGGVAKLPPKDQIELEAALYLLQMQAIKSDLAMKELAAKTEQLPALRKLEDEQLKDGGTEDILLDRQIDIATAALDQTRVLAPSPGTILAIGAHAGETSTGQLLTMGDLTSIVAQAEIDQSDLSRIHADDEARVLIHHEAVAGKIARIGNLVGFNQMRSVDPRAVQDLRVVRVTIQLETPEPASRYIGMQVDVAIKPGMNSRATPPATANP